MENHQTEQQSVDTESRPGLYERLSEYAETDYYPFHMPGHKRADLDFPNPYKMDVTEIEGFDNLHHAEGILLESPQSALACHGRLRLFPHRSRPGRIYDLSWGW